MKKIEIVKELDLEDVVDILSLETQNQFSYKKERDGIRCTGPFYVKGRYSTINEVKNFKDVFEFDIFASNEKLDGENFELLYTGYDYSVQDECMLTLFFDVYGIYGNEIHKEEIKQDTYIQEETIQIEEESEELDLSMMEELFDEKDHVVTSYSFVVVRKADTYESIAERYNVDVNILKEVNHNKEIMERDLVVLPYALK